MCNDAKTNRFLCMFHKMVMNDSSNIPLDTWMDENVPDDYRVVSVLADKMVTDEITTVFTIVMERRDG